MSSKTRKNQSPREYVQRMVDTIDDEYLSEVAWMLEGFVAKSLNDRYRKEQKNRK